MNIKTIRSKSNSSTNALLNRVIKIEKTLLQLTKLLENIAGKGAGDVSAGATDYYGGEKTEYFVKSIISAAEAAGNIANKKISTPPIVARGGAGGQEGLILSRGQIIAELAAAIAKIGERNS